MSDFSGGPRTREGVKVPRAFRSTVPDVSRAEFKRAALKRMRALAVLLLVLMTVIFVTTSVVHVDWPWLPYLRAFAEAGMVGACADWFAVVALFRHPLGLPIPHTAIIPNNKDRIGESLGRFVEENFLTPENVIRRLARVNIAKAAGTWLAEPANSDRA